MAAGGGGESIKPGKPGNNGILYVVATPIGNLEDITLRALSILKEADLIAAEDTRHSKKLLNHFGIVTALISYHEHSEDKKTASIIEKIKSGKKVALITDAGTPCVSDPGYGLVNEAIKAGIKVVPIPGASAVIGALSASGMPTESFTFKGFLSSKEEARKKQLTSMAAIEATYILYESPARLKKLLKNVEEIMGDVNIVVARELTKIYEEFLRGSVSEVLSQIEDRAVKGEVTVIIRSKPVVVDNDYRETLKMLLLDGTTVKDAADAISRDYNVSKKEVYKMALTIKDKKGFKGEN